MMDQSDTRTLNGELGQFAEGDFLSPETYKRNGQAVRTPVWFAQDGERLIVRAYEDSGKVKRLRNNPLVRVAPCDSRGMLLGERAEGTTRFAGGEETKLARALLGRKYGKLKSGFDTISTLIGATWTVIVVHTNGSCALEEVQ
jgi:PPOX class probable F420-dependent enzyme